MREGGGSGWCGFGDGHRGEVGVGEWVRGGFLPFLQHTFTPNRFIRRHGTRARVLHTVDHTHIMSCLASTAGPRVSPSPYSAQPPLPPSLPRAGPVTYRAVWWDGGLFHPLCRCPPTPEVPRSTPSAFQSSKLSTPIRIWIDLGPT